MIKKLKIKKICETCACFKAADRAESKKGECRVEPPGVTGGAASIVDRDYWCAQWRSETGMPAPGGGLLGLDYSPLVRFDEPQVEIRIPDYAIRSLISDRLLPPVGKSVTVERFGDFIVDESGELDTGADPHPIVQRIVLTRSCDRG